MTVEQISWQLVEGIQSLNNLMDMLREAVVSAGGKIKTSYGSRDANGHEFLLEDGGKNFWVGISYKEPDAVRFEAYDVDKKLAEGIGHGEIRKHDKGKYKWREQLTLGSEEVHFFALTKEKQMRRLEDFVSSCCRDVAKAFPR